MVSSPTGPDAAVLTNGLVSRYEALARIAELIRYHPDEKVLFETCASELHQVVAFDGLSWLDPAANWVHWHFLEPYDSALEAPRYEISRRSKRSHGGCTRISSRW